MMSNQTFCRTLSDISDTLFFSLENFRHLSQNKYIYIHSETNSVTARLQKHQNSLSAVGHRVRHVRHTNTNTEQQ